MDLVQIALAVSVMPNSRSQATGVIWLQSNGTIVTLAKILQKLQRWELMVSRSENLNLNFRESVRRSTSYHSMKCRMHRITPKS